MSLICRLARPDERVQLEALQWHASLTNEDDRQLLHANPDAINLPAEWIAQGLVLVAELEGAVRGFAAVMPPRNKVAELDGLFVDPAWGRRGVGTFLIGAALAQARLSGAERVDVVAGKGAVEFYRHCGFTVDGEVATRFNMGVAMHVDLTR